MNVSINCKTSYVLWLAQRYGDDKTPNCLWPLALLFSQIVVLPLLVFSSSSEIKRRNVAGPRHSNNKRYKIQLCLQEMAPLGLSSVLVVGEDLVRWHGNLTNGIDREQGRVS